MSDERNKTINDSKLEKDGMQIMANSPYLKNKIKVDVGERLEKANWYIKFNTALDPETINNNTMVVTETNGYILNTSISYRQSSNLIVISPLEEFKRDEYYILNISRNVHSAKGQKLGKEINILFKLVGGQISEFEILKSTAKVPKPRPKPKKPADLKTDVRVYSTGNDKFEGTESYKLPYAPMTVNLYTALAGMVVTLGGLPFNLLPVTAAGLVLILLGITHIIMQFSKKSLRSVLFYNRGALAFNREKYNKAQRLLNKAFTANNENEMAEYALSKLKFYL